VHGDPQRLERRDVGGRALHDPDVPHAVATLQRAARG
jgi:hypothetical protein